MKTIQQDTDEFLAHMPPEQETHPPKLMSEYALAKARAGQCFNAVASVVDEETEENKIIGMLLCHITALNQELGNVADALAKMLEES